MHVTLLPLLLFPLLLSAGTPQLDLRCSGKLIHRGDRMFEVRELCGEPDVVVPLHTVLTAQYGYVPAAEEWQYNHGPGRLMRFLVFRNGRLVQIRTGGFGFAQTDRTCSPVDLVRGMSQLELQARCGEPQTRELRTTRTRYRVDAIGRVYPAGLVAEDWIYDFGSNRFLQIVTLIHGRVVNVEQSRLRGGG